MRLSLEFQWPPSRPTLPHTYFILLPHHLHDLPIHGSLLLGGVESLLQPAHCSFHPILPPSFISAQTIGTASSANNTHPFFSLAFLDMPILPAWGVKDVHLWFAPDPASRQIRRSVPAKSGALTRASDQHALTRARTSLMCHTRLYNCRTHVSRYSTLTTI